MLCSLGKGKFDIIASYVGKNPLHNKKLCKCLSIRYDTFWHFYDLYLLKAYSTLFCDCSISKGLQSELFYAKKHFVTPFAVSHLI